MPESLEKLTESYFDYLAKCFPVMCASDEFHFLPRAAAASRYYDRMESLAPASIEECILTLREFQSETGSGRFEIYLKYLRLPLKNGWKT